MVTIFQRDEGLYIYIYLKMFSLFFLYNKNGVWFSKYLLKMTDDGWTPFKCNYLNGVQHCVIVIRLAPNYILPLCTVKTQFIFYENVSTEESYYKYYRLYQPKKLEDSKTCCKIHYIEATNWKITNDPWTNLLMHLWPCRRTSPHGLVNISRQER